MTSQERRSRPVDAMKCLTRSLSRLSVARREAGAAPEPVARRRWPVLALVAALALGSVGVVLAATGHTTAYGLITTMMNDAFDGIQLTTVPPATHQNLVYVNTDVQYDLTGQHTWESATWVSPAGQHYPASLLGTDWSTAPMEGRYIQLRNLTVDHTDLDAQNVQFRFHPVSGDTSLTLNEGSLTSLNIPGFKADSVITLTASGNSSIEGWTGSVESGTALNVLPGGTLTFERCGDMSQTLVTSSLFFRHPLGNTATVDGGTLRLLTSWMTWGKGAVDPAHLSNMIFKNGAVLDLTGDRSILEADNLDLLGATVKVGDGGTRLKSRGIVKLDSASVSLAEAGTLTAEGLEVYGTNTFALPKEFRSGSPSVTAGSVVLHPDARLTLGGSGSMAVTFLLDYMAPAAGQQYPPIVIDGAATLYGTKGAHLVIRPGSPITLTRTGVDVFGLLSARDGSTLEIRAATGQTNPIVNHGQISSTSGGAIAILGPVTIQGGSEGIISAEDDGILAIGDPRVPASIPSSLTTGNNVELFDFSWLNLPLDPSARTNGQLRTSGTVAIESFAGLSLFVVNDVALAPGVRFVLVDYGRLTGATTSSARFNGYPDGGTFKLGINTYRINYRDTGDPGYAGAITLTSVAAPLAPASLGPATQTLSGTVGLGFTPSATMTPTGFVGTVTYSISPNLPAGLRFDIVTGVVSGFPTAASASTTYTIRGTGSTSGSATATVTLSIAMGTQTITFGPAPAPTYASGGGFLVSASASSGLPVTYSSLTPAVCTAGGGNTVVILAAGGCTVAANQVGDANYGAAPQVTQAITIAKAPPLPLTLFAIPASILVTETSALSTSGGSGTGAITFAVTGGPCTITPPATLGSPSAGSCTVQAAQAADLNYTGGTSNTVAVQVGPGAQATLVLTATPTSIAVNGTTALATTGGSGNGAVTYAVNSGPCTLVDATHVKGMAEGKCQVVATKAAEGIYGPATSNPVTLTVTPLVPPALVLTATPATVGFGGSTTLATTGGIPGAPVSYMVTGPCSVSGNTLVGTGPGTCVVTATQAATSTYGPATSSPVTVPVKERTTIFSYPNATITVGQPLVLTPVLGGFTNPTFSVLYGSLPAGLTLNPVTGVISGVPTGSAGTFDAVITAFENNAYDAALAVIDVQATVEVPTLSEWGLLLLGLGLALAGMRLVRGGA